MNASTRWLPLPPMLSRAETWVDPLRRSSLAADEKGEGLEVRICQRHAWELLDDVIHGQVCGFLADGPRIPTSTTARCVRYRATGPLPESFIMDIQSGGPGLRRAFPGLVRTVERVSVTMTGVAVEIVCKGQHTGPFYDLFRPTGRSVRFSEVHDLIVHHGVLVEDAVAVDFRSVLRQLAGFGPRSVR
jgi:SnoaL-like polyketide cyclase